MGPLTVDTPALCVPQVSLDASHVTVTGEPASTSAFDVDALLATSATYATAAMDRALGRPVSTRAIDLNHLLAWCTTSVAIHGEAVPAWSELSGVYQTKNNRHLQVHCNFDHHAQRLVETLRCEPNRAAVTAAISKCDAFELESDLIECNAIGAAVRTLEEWAEHPHAIATNNLPLLTVNQIGDADPNPTTSASPDSPLGGQRILDCSRVLAGPVAGNMLASFGADVLRVGADHLPSVPICVIATGSGKRNASVDLRKSEGVETMRGLLAETDVWLDAYRPGAMSSYGLAPELVAELRPGIVIVQISAFDWIGPWAGRRGFDSIVQSTTGVRDASGKASTTESDDPIGLPVQALDYATGFLAAGLTAQLMRRQRDVGGSWLGRTSLLRARNWLVGSKGPTPFTPTAVEVAPDLLTTMDSEFGQLTMVKPFVGSARNPPTLLGTAPPKFQPRS